MISIVDALNDPALFEPWFSGPSWAVWKIVIKAAFGIKLTKRELKIFRSLAGRDPPKGRVKELWIVAGRRGGKDSVASAIAAWFAAFVDYAGLLRPGEKASVLYLAVDKPQAAIALRYSKAYFERINMLKGMVTRETADGLDLNNGAELTVLSSSFRTVRGRSVACAVMDECAYLRSEESANPDAEVYAALMPGMATLPGAMLIGISSPYRRSGLLYEKFRDHYGKPDDDVLVIKAASRALNPTLPQKVVDDAMARDPAAARAEWLAEWRDDIAAFLSRELIESGVDTSVTVRPPIPGVAYRAFCDPSGGVSDAFTLGIGHAEGEAVLLDCLLEIPAPFNPTAATKQIADTIKAYGGLTSVTGDRYAASWTVDAFAKHGVRYKHSERDRSAIYSDALPLFTAGRARLVDNRKLVTQLANLERRTSSGGRDRIDHPPGSHDDLANAAAGALVLAALHQRPPERFVPPFSVSIPRSFPGSSVNDRDMLR